MVSSVLSGSTCPPLAVLGRSRHWLVAKFGTVPVGCVLLSKAKKVICGPESVSQDSSMRHSKDLGGGADLLLEAWRRCHRPERNGEPRDTYRGRRQKNG